jgi:hypothetical protein
MTSTDESTADHGRTADMTDSGRERIDSASDADVERWARTLDASPRRSATPCRRSAIAPTMSSCT